MHIVRNMTSVVLWSCVKATGERRRERQTKDTREDRDRERKNETEREREKGRDSEIRGRDGEKRKWGRNKN